MKLIHGFSDCYFLVNFVMIGYFCRLASVFVCCFSVSFFFKFFLNIFFVCLLKLSREFRMFYCCLITASILVAITAQMTRFATAVACLLALWAVTLHVATFVANVAHHSTGATLFTITFTLSVLIGTVTSYMSSFIAGIAAWIIW